LFVSGTFDADYVETGVFVDEVDQLFLIATSMHPHLKNCFAHFAVTVLIWVTGTRQALG